MQFLAGPRDVRSGVFGFMLRLIALISLIIGPIALLVFFQLQFLPYHDEAISWWQRVALVLDLVLLWMLWPSIGRGTNAGCAGATSAAQVARPAVAERLPVLLVFTVATFPGEWLHATGIP